MVIFFIFYELGVSTKFVPKIVQIELMKFMHFCLLLLKSYKCINFINSFMCNFWTQTMSMSPIHKKWCIQRFWGNSNPPPPPSPLPSPPHTQKNQVKGRKILNLMLLHCWKRHLRHFPVILSSSRPLYFCLYFLGARVWVLIPHLKYQNPAGYITNILPINWRYWHNLGQKIVWIKLMKYVFLLFVYC